MADFKTKLEQKYDINKITEMINNGKIINVNKYKTAVPGDIYVENWDQETGEAFYFDITIGNIYCDTYYKQAAITRGYVSNKLEENKYKKYDNIKNIIPLTMETTGGYGQSFKLVLKRLCKRIEIRKQLKFEIVTNRVKSK